MKKKIFLILFVLLITIKHSFSQSIVQGSLDNFVTVWNTESTNEIIILGAGTGYNYQMIYYPVSDPSLIVGPITTTSNAHVINGLSQNTDYVVEIMGDFPRMYINNNAAQKNKLRELRQWGNNVWFDFSNAFHGATLFDITAIDTPNLSQVNSLFGIFSGCSNLEGSTANWNWNTSNITDLSYAFNATQLFNQNINSWDVSNVVRMNYIFASSWAFNSPLNNWNTAMLEELSHAFAYCNFNNDITTWNVTSLKSMANTFRGNYVFNQDLSGWNTPLLEDLNSTFYQCSSFNQDISGWDVSNVTTFHYTFGGAYSFNQNLGNWNLKSTNPQMGMNIQNMLRYSGLDCANYTATLIGWANNPETPNDMNLESPMGLFYDSHAIYARDSVLIGQKNWTILPNSDNLKNSAGSISGSDSLCVGSETIYSSDVWGGVWSSSDNSVATITAAGEIVAIAPGTVDISYAVYSRGCDSTVTKSLIVLPTSHSYVLNGPDTICPSAIESYTTTAPNGVWSTDNTGIAIVDQLGELTTSSAGEITIYYEFNTVNTCYSNILSKNVTIIDNERPAFVEALPMDTTVNCDAIPPAAVLTATDNCLNSPTVVYQETSLEGLCMNAYTLTRTWTVTDDYNNTTTHTQIINVQDTIAPIVASCPSSITVYTPEDICGALVTWTAPTVTDNCGTSILTSSHTIGSVFPVGLTTVIYTATDECGNVATCSFDVVVIDSMIPKIDITNVITVCEGAAITWQENITDNCGVASIVSSHNNGSVFPIGTTTVTYTVTDIHGNVATDSFDVIVNSVPTVSISGSSKNKTVCLATAIQLEVSSVIPGYSYTWYQDGLFANSGEHFNVANAQTMHAGLYTVVAENTSGCISAADSIHLDITSCGITITETLSPNNDGKNDVFYVDGLDAYVNTKVWIHNRWGAEVYHSDDYQNDWSGKSQSKLVSGDVLPEGTYFYILQLGGEEGQPNAGEIYKGYFYIKL